MYFYVSSVICCPTKSDVMGRSPTQEVLLIVSVTFRSSFRMGTEEQWRQYELTWDLTNTKAVRKPPDHRSDYCSSTSYLAEQELGLYCWLMAPSVVLSNTDPFSSFFLFGGVGPPL
jgi:hypothetical protein